MIEGTKRKIDGRVYELWGQYPTAQMAVGQKRRLIRTGWATHVIVLKASRGDEKNPFRLWTHLDPKVSWERAVSKGVLKEIDREIAPLVRDLNANGIYTTESCSGHGSEYARLWILKEGFSLETFHRIMKKHGMKNILRRRMYGDSTPGSMYFTFDLPGKVAYKQDRKRVFRPAKKRSTPRATGLLWEPIKLV